MVTNNRTFSRLLYSQLPGNPGGPVTSRVVSNDFFSTTKTDTVRRRRPTGIALHENATSFVSATQERVDAIGRWYRADGTFYDYSAVEQVGELGWGNEFPLLSNEALFSRVRAVARDNYFNIANMLGEYRQTASTFVDIAQTVVRLTRAVRRPLTRGFIDPRVRTVDREAANRWLQYQYGIRPLMSDMKEAMDILQNGLTTRPLVIPINVGIGQRYSIPLHRKTVAGWDLSLTVQARHQLRYNGIAVLKTNHLLSSAAQLGLINPVSLAWELTPYSFVVDWFINVGEVIESLDTPLIVERIIGTIGSKYDYARYLDLYGAAGYYRKVDKGRSVSGVSLIPPLRWRPHITTTRVTSAIALLRQTLNIRH